MRLYELVPVSADLVVHNEATGHTMVLTPQGAVYNTEDTSDLRNIAIAFGLLTTSDGWRPATMEEIEELRAHPPTAMMELSWVVPPPKPRPTLTLLRGGRLPAYERGDGYTIIDGTKFYDDDETQ